MANTNMSVWDPQAAEQDIELVHSQFRSLIQNKELTDILGDEYTQRMKDWDVLISRRRKEPFSLVVLGDFKRGKSTIINAILGKQLAPVNVAPETFTINVIEYGESDSAVAFLESGKEVPLAMDDLVRERLEVLTEELGEKITHVNIKDNSPVLKQIRIVDTPGLCDLDDLDTQVKEYLVNADSVVYIASALLPFSESEQLFLSSHIKPQNFSKLFVLVNMLDALGSREDIRKILNRITMKCEEIIPNAIVYGISGIDEFRRKTAQPRPDTKGTQDLYENGFLKFEISLQREIITQKDVIRTQRVISMLYKLIDDINSRIQMISDMTQLGRKQLDELCDTLERECSGLAEAIETKKPILTLSIIEMQQEAERWMYEFFKKLRDDILAVRFDTTDEDIEKHFYSFLMEKVGEAYRKCFEIHESRISALINTMSKSMSSKLGISNLSNGIESFSMGSLMNTINHNISDSVMSVATGSGNDAFPSTALASFKQILKKKKKSDIIDTALENYDDIRNSTVKDLKTAYKALEDEALKHLDSIYQNQVNVGREAVNQTVETIGHYDSIQIAKAFSDATNVLMSSQAVLGKYQHSIE